ncbi:hypothetical protein BGX28_010533, partial [Mortierella sp. GBA30]
MGVATRGKADTLSMQDDAGAQVVTVEEVEQGSQRADPLSLPLDTDESYYESDEEVLDLEAATGMA